MHAHNYAQFVALIEAYIVNGRYVLVARFREYRFTETPSRVCTLHTIFQGRAIFIPATTDAIDLSSTDEKFFQPVPRPRDMFCFTQIVIKPLFYNNRCVPIAIRL